MVHYSYDEGGVMSSYRCLVSRTDVSAPIDPEHVRLPGCQCQPCIQHREDIGKSNKRTILHPQVGAKAVGWAVFAYFAYRVATTKSETTMYDPYDILGVKRGTTEQEIKQRMSLMPMARSSQQTAREARRPLKSFSRAPLPPSRPSYAL
ncbi:hypothetical protein EXIGLDRAFT_847029 [Exidia glandulosa HHB12029]|uniref:J domain-containing protein n=1 Tax=Exidia glandulosa HHB12029 TaxID=1314781 RepID=A0A166N9Y2_EXIGL|nr:hypothetical protein EXIGLDRAFT_847029 [Exidia glandulosa HHB12029]